MHAGLGRDEEVNKKYQMERDLLFGTFFFNIHDGGQ
jgi:hypothetical protein